MVEYDDDDLDQILRALSDRNRRRIIQLLRESGPLQIGSIASIFSMSLNGVSKHIKVLQAAGLVKREIRGRDHYISANWRAFQPLSDWLDFYRQYWEKRLDKLAKIFQEKEDSHE
ncbi:MAG: metalloregulator ArsR/SmtB family transcription factor [Spirochaetota bacterium]